MTHRVRHGQELAARVQGTYGVYRTRARLGRRPEGQCSCPSEAQPCKHVLALQLTWRSNPESFFDVASVLRDLATRSKPDLLAAIAEMALRAPESLGALGIDAFEVDEGEADA